MGVFSDTWTPNSGTDYSRQINFDVAALEIDNFSAYYIFIPDANKYISPNTVGTIVPLTHWNGYVKIQRVTGNPAYPVTDTGNLNSPVNISVYSDALPATPGTSFNSTIVNAVIISGPVTVTGNVGITGTVTVAGTVSISGSVTVSGTVAISGPVTVNGSVSITGTTNVNVTNSSITVAGSVSITGTPAVTISGTPTVNIGGTVNANITAGTVNVQNVTNGILSAAGNLVYVGTINSAAVTYVSGGAGHGQVPQANANTVTVTLGALERAIIVAVPNLAAIANGGKFRVVCATHQSPPVAVQTRFIAGIGELAVFYVNPLISSQWDIWLGDDAGTFIGYIFTDTALPVMDIARSGQQAMAQSIPVTVASDQSRIPVIDNLQDNAFTMINQVNAGPGTFFPAVAVNPGFRGVHVSLRVTAVAGGGTVTAQLIGVTADQLAEVSPILLASPTLNSITRADMFLYPGIPAVANQQANMILPAFWRVNAIVAVGTVSYTVTVAYLR